MFWPGGCVASFAPLRFLRWCSSINGYLIEWLMPFTGARHSTNGHRAVFDCILLRQCRVDTCALARWTHSVFCAYGVFYAGSLPAVVAGSNGLCHSQVIRHSTNGHRAVLHRILTRQCRVDTRTLARWMYNIFCIYGVPRGNFLPLAARHLIGYQLFLLLP